MSRSETAPDPHRWPGPAASTSGFAQDIDQPLLQAALTAGAAAAWHTNLQTRQRWWSPEMFRIHGLSNGKDLPQDYMDLVHPDDRQVVAASFRQSVESGSHRAQYRVVWPDGSAHWIEGVGQTQRNAAGQPLSISGVCSLIDMRKQEEADLRFLAQASAELARTTDYEETLRRVAAMSVPHFADWCAVDMLDADAKLKRLAVAHIDPSKVNLAQELHRRYPPDPEAPVGAWNVLKTGQAELLAEIPDDLLERSARDAQHLAIARSLGLRSYMGVPMVGAHKVLGVITFVSSDSGRIYGQRDLRLATDLASRAAVAVQNAALFRALRDSQSRQGFLLALTDVLRRNGSTKDVLTAISEMLGRHFHVDRVGYGDVDEAQDLIEYDVCWTDGTVPPLLGQFPASAFGPQVIERLRAGQTIAIANVRDHPLTSELQTIKTSHEVDTRAILVVPLSKAGRLRTIVYLNQRPERSWTAEDISLMEEVAERTRELIERGRTEDALRESEARWRGLFERMAEGFFVAEGVRDATGRITDFRFLQLNPAFEKLTGIAPSAAAGKRVTEVIPGLQREVIDRYAGVIESGEPAEFEVHVPALNDRWYEARAQRVGPGQFSVLFLEVTDRKQAQLELQRSADRYRTLFESIDEGFCILEVLFDGEQNPLDYRFLEVNPAFERQSGLADAVGRTIRELVPDIESTYIDTYGRVALTGQAIRFESQAQALRRWFDAFAFRIGDPGLHRVALLFTDITERKLAQNALVERESQLREADVRKDEFLATLAHELRNPLAPLRNGLAILRRSEGASAAGVRARELMERQLAHLVRLVDDLLDVSRVSQGKVAMKKTITSLQAVVDQALETARPLIDAAGHKLDVALPHDPVLLNADSTRIAQVLSNLLNNAAKYTPHGGHIALTAAVAEPGRLRISVQDDGVGIPPDMLERIFDLFTQVGSALDRSQGGLGIGLSLARRLVELHGGSIHAESKGEQRGSTFVVELPVQDIPRSTTSANTAPQPQSTLPGRRVLVVDDNIDAAETLALLLEMDGHGVQMVHSGAAALEAAPRTCPDLIFLDIGLPDLSGYEVAAKLREIPSLAGTLLVALTGWGGDRDRERARLSGIDMHLTKPVNHDDLAQALSRQKA